MLLFFVSVYAVISHKPTCMHHQRTMTTMSRPQLY